MVSIKNLFLTAVTVAGVLFSEGVSAVRGDGCGEYACGSATWTWGSQTRIDDVSMSVKDTKCDGHGAYVELRIVYTQPPPVLYRTAKVFKLTDSSCSGNYVVKNHPSWTNGWTIVNVEVWVCRSDAGLDTCYHEGEKKNPYY